MANPISVPGTVVPSGSLISPGGAQGVQGLQGTTALADATQNGLLRQVSGNTTDFIDGTNNSQALQPVIWSSRLRSFQALSNNTFEVDQRNAGNWVANPASGTFIMDRWFASKSALTGGFQACSQPGIVLLPGTNFAISQASLRVYLLTSQASLAAGDILAFQQQPEGPRWRELSNDAHSISLLVKSDVAPLKFSIALRDPAGARSLVKLCTISSSATWQLIPLPNLPLWASGGNFSATPGTSAYTLSIVLACGTTLTAPAADVWQNGNFLGAPGMDNWLSKAVGTNFYCAFIQHEPGAQCTTPIDCPFTQAYDDALRYFQKTYLYGTKPGSANVYPGACSTGWIPGGNSPAGFVAFKKPMAKIPTIIGYSPQTGAANNVTDTGTDRAISSTIDIGDAGFGGFTVSTTNSGFTWMRFHYTADTGW